MSETEKLKDALSSIHKPEPLKPETTWYEEEITRLHAKIKEGVVSEGLTEGTSGGINPHNGDPNELEKAKRMDENIKAMYRNLPYTPPTEEEMREMQEWGKSPTDFEKNLDLVLGDLRAFLLKKHSEYGSSYERPLNVLLDLSPALRIKARMEEKLARLLAGSTNEDTLKDLVGLWVHLQIAEKDGSV
jgi:hypothetical protein